MENRLAAVNSGASLLALSCIGFIASAPALAQTAPSEPAKSKEVELQGVTVTDTALNPDVNADKAESPKFTRPLLDTPQTVTVLTSQTLQQQNLLSLKDALSTVPGITFGAGEGGGGYGDNITLRGFSAATDIQIDGVRDAAQYSRSDTFNVDQIEVINGPNSAYGGSGSIGGTINLVSKRPKNVTQTTVTGSVGTDNYFRGTVDSNVKLSDTIAVRLNAMGHKDDVPGRDFEYRHRWGVAPALTIGLGTPTRLTALYVHQQDNNIPVYGVPYYVNGFSNGLLPGAKYSGYYGYKNIDHQYQAIDQGTLIFEHDFSGTFSVRNLTRAQKVKQNTYVDPPQGTYCLAGGVTPTGAACPAGFNAPGTFYPYTTTAGVNSSGPRGTARLTSTSTYYNELDLRSDTTILGMKNTMTLGASISQEDYTILSANLERNANGTTPATFNLISIADPNPVYTGPINSIRSSYAEGRTLDKAVYLFDTLNLTKKIEFNAGLRYEGQRTNYRTDTISTTGATLGQSTRGVAQISDEKLFSYRIGLIYKPIEDVSFYVAYGNSKTPVSSGVRSQCGATTSLPAGVDPCSAKPQTALTYEGGAKAEILHHKLLLTASVFRTDRTNYSVATNDPLVGALPVNDGRSRVDGVTFGATGRITRNWTIFANYTYLKSKVLQSISTYCKTHPGQASPVTGGTTVTCPASDTQAGNPLTQVPKNSGSLFTTYTLPFGLQLGYGATYQGSFLLVNTNPGPFYKAHDYLTHRAMLSYPITDKLLAQVNIQNFTNKHYFTAIRNNGWATPGELRQAVFSLGYTF